MKKKEKKYLSGQNDEEATKEAHALLIISPHDSNSTNRVSITTTIRDTTVGKDGDDHMLLHVERSRVQTKSPPKKAVLVPWKRSGHELSNGQNSNLHENG